MSERSSFVKGLQSVIYVLRLRGPLAFDPNARLLHALVLSLAVWYGLWTVILLPLYPGAVSKLPSVALEEAAPLAALVLLRFGFFRQASIAYLAITWAFATVVVAHDGGIRSPVQIFYGTLPVLASWLLGYRATLWTMAACASSGLVFALIELAGINLRPTIPPTPLGVWAVLLQVILIGAVPVAQVVRTLQNYREHLEQLVQQRTAELVETRDQALAANRAKSTFLAHMSHELRTPLNAILGFSALVRTDTSLSDQHRKDLTVVGNSGEHLLGLIDDVLDIAKIEAGSITVESVPFDLRTLVHDTVNMLRERAQFKNLELLLDISSDVPQLVRADPGKLRQVLTNLVGNAVKYTDEGSVVLRADARPGDDSQHPVLLFDVEDTGIGIAPEDQARIFDPFVQAGNTGTRKGTGLGLSISKHFVQLLGGTIQVESIPGQGSCFHVEVPTQTTEASEGVADTAPLGPVVGLMPGQPDYRILIVEDQRENWLLLQRLLQTVGFEMQVAEDGRRAVEMFATWRPHLIWMDLRLPVLGGLEAAKRIRDLDGGREVKIVAVTASALASQREVLAAGLDDFVRKPYRPQEIFSCMARQLGVRYAYGTSPPAAAEELPVTLRPESLVALPTTLRDGLEEAVIELDRERIARLVSQVAEQDASLGSALTRLVDKLAYTPILRALQSGKNRFTAASA